MATVVPPVLTWFLATELATGQTGATRDLLEALRVLIAVLSSPFFYALGRSSVLMPTLGGVLWSLSRGGSPFERLFSGALFLVPLRHGHSAVLRRRLDRRLRHVAASRRRGAAAAAVSARLRNGRLQEQLAASTEGPVGRRRNAAENIEGEVAERRRRPGPHAAALLREGRLFRRER